jgi:murein DD-endopeptidase MepM/ murein hydrolase activator NlpD
MGELDNKKDVFFYIKSFFYKNFDYFKKWSNIEKDLSKEEKVTEKNFFLSVFIIGMFVFTSVSAENYLEYRDLEFWPKSEVVFEESEDFLLAEDGYFGKTSIPTIGDIDRSTVSRIITYEVQPGDTLDLISSKYGISKRTILDNNEVKDPNSLVTGFGLMILPVDGYLYEIKLGDNLSSISKKFNINESILTKQNNIDNTDLIAGNTLILPGIRKPTPTPIIIDNIPSETVVAKVIKKPVTKSKNTIAKPKVKYTAPRTGKKYSWPVVNRGTLTQGFRYGHYGIDIWGPNQPGIKAIASGKVIRSSGGCGARSYGCNGGYGNVIVIDHYNGVKALYAHNSRLDVKAGQKVKAGQVIAKMGNSGNTRGRTGIHLHFELTINGKKVNPLRFL